MECVLFPRLPYTELPTVVRSQREALDAKIRGFSNSHIVHPGLQHFADGQRQRLHIASVPGGYQAGGFDRWPPHRSTLNQCAGTGQALNGHSCAHPGVLAWPQGGLLNDLRGLPSTMACMWSWPS